MRAVVQRACDASVTIADRTVASFSGPGLVVLLGVTHDDGPVEVGFISRKIADLRIMRDELSLGDLLAAGKSANVIVVSQFTLYADTKKGRRPSWNGAAPGSIAEPIVAQVVDSLRDRGFAVGTGEFGADMTVELRNDGPVTLILETGQ